MISLNICAQRCSNLLEFHVNGIVVYHVPSAVVLTYITKNKSIGVHKTILHIDWGFLPQI